MSEERLIKILMVVHELLFPFVLISFRAVGRINLHALVNIEMILW